MLHFVSEYDPSTTGFEAGFKIDLNEELVKHPNSTYLVRMDSDEMIGSQIRTGDILVVDRSLPLHGGSLAVVYLNGEKLVRYYYKAKNSITIYSSHPNGTKPYTLKENDLFEIFGVVVHVIRTFTLESYDMRY